MTARLDDGLDRTGALAVGHGYTQIGATVSKLTPLDLFAEAGWHVSPRVTAFARGDWMPVQRDSWSAVAGIRYSW